MPSLFHMHHSRPSSPKPAQRATTEAPAKPAPAAAAPAPAQQQTHHNLLQKYLMQMLPANEVAML